MNKIVKTVLFVGLFLCTAGCQKPPLAYFTYTWENTDTGVKVNFENKSENAEYYIWDFGDGSDSYETTSKYDGVYHRYTQSGTYTVTLQACKANKTSWHRTTFTISSGYTPGGGGGGGGGTTNPPVANFSFTGNNQYAPSTVQFTNLSSNATSYIWNFGDGYTSSSANPSHVYANPGNYTVTLKAMNSAGSDLSTRTVVVKNDPASWTLTKLVLNAYPITDNGDNWDYTDAGPDIYFKIYDANNTLIYTSADHDNVQPTSLPVTWNVSGCTLTTVSDACKIKFYDKDGALDPDDVMGTINFTPSNYNFNTSTCSWTAGSWSVSMTYHWN